MCQHKRKEELGLLIKEIKLQINAKQKKQEKKRTEIE